MAITFTQAEETPALRYDRIFMSRLTLDQAPVQVDATPPKYALMIEIRRYAVDADGNRHYATKSDVIPIADYYAEAMKKAATGDMDLANAAAAIEAALAVILEDQKPELGAVTVTGGL